MDADRQGPREVETRAGPERLHSIGVVMHPTRAVDASLQTILGWAASRRSSVLARESDRARVPASLAAGLDFRSDASFADGVQAVVSLGGDGTMLGAMRLVARAPVPVLGVNHGTLGFLVEISPGGLDEALAQIARGVITIEPHRGLEVHAEVDLDPSVAFNDVVLTRRGRQGAVVVDLRINGAKYGYYSCDALVVATSTGSTAYSYSAGGPVLSPSAAATVVTPVAPMSGIARSIVFGVDDEISLAVEDDASPVGVDVDGVEAGAISGTVDINALPSPAQVVRLDSTAHAQRSRVKLSLRDLPLRPDQLRELVPLDIRRRGEF